MITARYSPILELLNLVSRKAENLINILQTVRIAAEGEVGQRDK